MAGDRDTQKQRVTEKEVRDKETDEVTGSEKDLQGSRGPDWMTPKPGYQNRETEREGKGGDEQGGERMNMTIG